ncbi:MAG: 30S ribosomal protein S18 [Planctomycetota bacterium]|jgi:small subunit ribosomal protein S18
MAKRPIKRPKKKDRFARGAQRFPERGGADWRGPLIAYREVDLLRKFLSSSSKITSRKRAGTNAKEQAAIRTAVKQARFLALVPYAGT